jgi:replicative DNA helicase
MFFCNSLYTNFINDNFDKRHYDNEPQIAELLDASIQIYRQYKKVPSLGTIDIILTKMSQKTSIDKQFYLNLFKASINSADSVDANFAKDLILDFIKNKSMYYAIIDNLDDIQKRKDITNMLERFNKVSGISIESDSGMNYFDELDEHFIELCKPENKIKFNYASLDWATHGGITRNEKSLNIVAAPPGLGKSMLLTNMAANYLEQGLTVFIVSLEMSANMYASRIDALLANHDINTLKFDSETCKTNIRNFHQLHSTAKLIIKEWPPSYINTMQMKSWIDKLALIGHTPDVLIVDYLNLMQPNVITKNTNMYEKVGNIGRELRALSYEIGGIPIWSATQVNRSGCAKNTEPELDKISESMGTAQTADFLMSLWRTDEDMTVGKMNATILKNRWGGKVGTKLKFDIDYEKLKVFDCVDSSTMQNTNGENCAVRINQNGKPMDLVDIILDDI